jgi:hypothetical protein
MWAPGPNATGAGSVVIGGILSSTLLTLAVLCRLVHGREERRVAIPAEVLA